MPTIQTTLYQPQGRSVTGIVIPPDVIAELKSGKKPAVAVTVNGYAYRTTVAVMNGQFMIPFATEHRQASGINGGDAIEVRIELDTAPRTVEVPQDLVLALDARGLRERFDGLAFTYRKEHVRALDEARTPETRARRIAKVVEKLQEG